MGWVKLGHKVTGKARWALIKFLHPAERIARCTRDVLFDALDVLKAAKVSLRTMVMMRCDGARKPQCLGERKGCHGMRTCVAHV